MSTESPLAGDPQPSSDLEFAGGLNHAGDPQPSTDPENLTEDDGVLYDEDVTAQYGVVGFTLRELLIVGIWLIAFVTSFFPVHPEAGIASLWAQGIQWILPLGLPTVAVFLIVLRRFSPDGIRRVGSLGIDQFASVAFSVSALYWAAANWDLISVSAASGVFALTWVTIVQFFAALALVALTVFAPLIPGVRDDFRGRLVTLAHRGANPVRPVIARPRAAKDPADTHTATPQDSPDPELSEEHTSDEIAKLGLGDSVRVTSHASNRDAETQTGAAEIGLGATIGADDSEYVPGYARTSRDEFDVDDQDAAFTGPADESEPTDHTAADDRTGVIEDLDTTAPREVAMSSDPTEATPDAAAPAETAQPFWALAPTERDVFDDQGLPLFRIGPTAWALVIEDRGGAYVVRHDDGRIGYLHDIADITRS